MLHGADPLGLPPDRGQLPGGGTTGIDVGGVDRPAGLGEPTQAELDRYARLFNALDWDGVRALVSDECQLDLVSKSHSRGKQVGLYFARYEKESVELRVVRLEGRLALAAHVRGDAKPAYFILLEFEAGRVKSIRDFRYVPYIAAEAEFEPQ
jgi:RNA polymerase sigma-70 factor (ECF subfamily)